MKNTNYYDLETGEQKNLLDELIYTTLQVRVDKGIDCEAYKEGPYEDARQFMPIYVAKIITLGVYNSMKDKTGRYLITLRSELENAVSDRERFYKLRRCADENVAFSTVVGNNDSAFSDNELINLAKTEYDMASTLKKTIKKNLVAGFTLNYIADKLYDYVTVIDSVFKLMKRNHKKIEDYLVSGDLRQEIDNLTSEDKTPLEKKIDCYLTLRRIYLGQKIITERLKLKEDLQRMFISIRKDEPTFSDKEIFN